MAATYKTTTDLPQVIPVFPLDALLLPGAQLPLNIFEPRYLNMIDDAMASDRMIGMIQARGGDDRERPALAQVGCVGRITAFAETNDGRYLITITGVCRFALGKELPAGAPYRQVQADYVPFAADLASDAEPGLGAAEREPLLIALGRYLDRRDMAVDWEAAKEAPLDALVASLCMALPFAAAEKQAILEAEGLAGRAEVLAALLNFDAASGERDDDDAPPAMH